MGSPTTATASLLSKQNALKRAPLRSPSRSGEAHLRIHFCLLIRFNESVFLYPSCTILTLRLPATMPPHCGRGTAAERC